MREVACRSQTTHLFPLPERIPMDPFVVVLIIGAVALWVYSTVFKSGKREGSRKGYGVGFDRGRKLSSSGCLIFMVDWELWQQRPPPQQHGTICFHDI